MVEQLQIVNLKCLNCGGVLEIDAAMERFACGHCGSQQIVMRRGGTIALRPVVDAVARVQAGTDKTAAELALVRLGQELAQAQFSWGSFEADFSKWKTQRPQSILPLVAMVSSILGFLVLFSAAKEVGPIFAFLTFVVCAAGALPAFVWGLKGSMAVKKSDREHKQAMWNRRDQEVRRLQALIAKQRTLVDT